MVRFNRIEKKHEHCLNAIKNTKEQPFRLIKVCIVSITAFTVKDRYLCTCMNSRFREVIVSGRWKTPGNIFPVSIYWLIIRTQHNNPVILQKSSLLSCPFCVSELNLSYFDWPWGINIATQITQLFWYHSYDLIWCLFNNSLIPFYTSFHFRRK